MARGISSGNVCIGEDLRFYLLAPADPKFLRSHPPNQTRAVESKIGLISYLKVLLFFLASSISLFPSVSVCIFEPITRQNDSIHLRADLKMVKRVPHEISPASPTFQAQPLYSTYALSINDTHHFQELDQNVDNRQSLLSFCCCMNHIEVRLHFVHFDALLPLSLSPFPSLSSINHCG